MSTPPDRTATPAGLGWPDPTPTESPGLGWPPGPRVPAEQTREETR
jgi:hypothetical protein